MTENFENLPPKYGKEKGEYGYRIHHRKMQFCMVSSGALMIIVQLAARNFTETQAVKNILTVMAILSVLPTANIASPLLAAWRFKTPPKEFFQKVRPFEEKATILYDLIITSKEAVMPMDAIAVHPGGIYCYCTSPRVDEKKGEKFLNEMLASHKMDPHAKIIKDEASFLRRLEGLKPASEYEDDGSVSYTAELLKHLSM